MSARLSYSWSGQNLASGCSLPLQPCPRASINHVQLKGLVGSGFCDTLRGPGSVDVTLGCRIQQWMLPIVQLLCLDTVCAWYVTGQAVPVAGV